MPFDPEKKTLLDGVTGAGTESAWVDVWPYEDVSFHIYGMGSGDTVKIWASNEDGDPSNRVQVNGDITDSDDMVVIEEIPEKIQVELDANGSGNAITVIMHGRIPK